MTPPPDLTRPTTPHEQAVEARRLRWLWLWLRDDTLRHRALFAAGLATIGAVGVMAYFTYRLQQLPYDLAVTVGLQGVEHDLFREAMLLISLPGHWPWNALLVLGGGLLIGWRLGWRDGAFLIVATMLQGLANHLIKVAIGRPRPTADLVEILLPADGKSFPSGHVMLYTFFFGFLFFLAWSRLPRGPFRLAALTLTGAMVLLAGPSRIYLGAHWLSDVVAAHLLALIILLFAIEFYVHWVAPSRETIATTALDKQGVAGD